MDTVAHFQTKAENIDDLFGEIFTYDLIRDQTNAPNVTFMRKMWEPQKKTGYMGKLP